MNANFSNANLSNASFADADLSNARFSGTDVEGADFTNANLAGVNLCDCSLIGASFFDEKNNAGVGAKVETAIFTREQLESLSPAQRNFIESRAILQ